MRAAQGEEPSSEAVAEPNSGSSAWGATHTSSAGCYPAPVALDSLHWGAPSDLALRGHWGFPPHVEDLRPTRKSWQGSAAALPERHHSKLPAIPEPCP